MVVSFDSLIVDLVGVLNNRVDNDRVSSLVQYFFFVFFVFFVSFFVSFFVFFFVFRFFFRFSFFFSFFVFSFFSFITVFVW
jgi:hypothetical protein